jgi:hypothetical protein
MNEEEAKKRIEELQGYYAHLAAYVAVNLFLIVINLVTLEESGEIWFFYPLLGWGIGLFIHTIVVFFRGRDWQDRKMQELTGWSTTRDELDRLSERTDTLIKILSSVNWEKIDPELVETKQNLLDARQKIVALQDRGEGASHDEVIREIEKLEEFVTSSKFDYYEMAADDK